MVVNIGPCQVLFNGSPLGKTRGGASLSFRELKEQWVNAEGVLDDERMFVGAEGVVKRFSIEPQVDACLLGDWGELVFKNEEMGWQLVLPSARLYFPDNLALGIFEQRSWDVRLVARRTEGGNLYRLEAL